MLFSLASAFLPMLSCSINSFLYQRGSSPCHLRSDITWRNLVGSSVYSLFTISSIVKLLGSKWAFILLISERYWSLSLLELIYFSLSFEMSFPIFSIFFLMSTIYSSVSSYSYCILSRRSIFVWAFSAAYLAKKGCFIIALNCFSRLAFSYLVSSILI